MNPIFFKYDSKNWTFLWLEEFDLFYSIWIKELSLFSNLTQRSEPLLWTWLKEFVLWTWLKEFVFEYDSKNVFFNMTIRIEPFFANDSETFFLTWLKEEELFFWKWLQESNIFYNVSQRIEPFFFNMTQRIEPLFSSIWFQKLNLFFN